MSSGIVSLSRLPSRVPSKVSQVERPTSWAVSQLHHSHLKSPLKKPSTLSVSSICGELCRTGAEQASSPESVEYHVKGGSSCSAEDTFISLCPTSRPTLGETVELEEACSAGRATGSSSGGGDSGERDDEVSSSEK